MRPVCSDISKAAGIYYGLSVRELRGPCRERRIAHPRQVAMALCRDMTQASLPYIGSKFGGLDHTTVLHGVGAARNREADLRAIALLAVRIRIERAARERHQVYEAIKRGQIIPTRHGEVMNG